LVGRVPAQRHPSKREIARLHAKIPDVILNVFEQKGERYWRKIDRAPEPRPLTNIHTINESIDRSVFDRCRTNPAYRPHNLRDWAQKYGRDLTTLTTSVRADDPSTIVPD
jgi:hypothetical protein